MLIPDGTYPFADGHVWAQPNLEQAVQVCRFLYKNRGIIGKQNIDLRCDDFLFSKVGGLYKKELEKLYGSGY